MIHGSYFLVDIKQNYLDEKCKIYELNDIGEFIWNQLDKTNNLKGIVNFLMKAIESDIDRKLLESDVADFVELLEQEHFVEVYDGGN